MEPNIDPIVEEARRMMPFPSAAWSVWEAATDPETTGLKLQGIIERDPGLAAQILRIANSAAYGQSGKVADLRRAVHLLGTQKIAELALAAGCSSGFRRFETRMLRHIDFWEHSFACAQLARAIAPSFGVTPSEAYAAALLHDIGYLVLFAMRSADMHEIFEIAHENKLEPCAVETEYLGFDHAHLGEALLRAWSLPEGICRAAGWHHDAANSATAPLAAVVYLANRAANLAETWSDENESSDQDTLDAIGQRLGYSAEELPEFFERVQRSAAELRGSLAA